MVLIIIFLNYDLFEKGYFVVGLSETLLQDLALSAELLNQPIRFSEAILIFCKFGGQELYLGYYGEL